MSDTITLEKARDIAYMWHNGMWSALYSFASSGEITEYALEEVDREMSAVKDSAHYEAGDLTDLGLLRAFLSEKIKTGNPLGFESVNLDACNNPEDLEELARVFSTLAQYATAKASGIKYRKRGAIAAACNSEVKADSIYDSLPRWARW